MSLFYCTCFWYFAIGAFIPKWQEAENQCMLLTEKKELLHYTNQSFTFLRSCHLAEGSAFPEGVCVERQEAEHSSVRVGGALLCVLHFPSGHSHASTTYCHGDGNVDLHTGTKYFLPKWISTSLSFLLAPLARGRHTQD